MTAKDLIKYWITGAENAWTTAEVLFKNKRYSDCLFFTHLALEKIIKGLIVQKTDEQPLPIHDLKKLARQTGLSLNSKQETDFDEMTTWNISARYDEIKFNFYKRATKEFAQNWFSKAKEYYLWLKKQY